jgi:hypothetical protein
MGSARTQKAVSWRAAVLFSVTARLCSVVKVRAETEGERWRCEVNVDHGGQVTHHVVTVRPADLTRWAKGTRAENVEDLVARSFDFLLEREPPNAILATFDLSVIQRYFPEYDRIFTTH